MKETAQLLDAVELFVRRFVVLDEAQATAAALWTAHTWTVDAAHATPYLYLTSAEPESGKTRLLEVFQQLVREPLSTMNISDAALFRAIEAKQPTLLFDEVDAIFNSKANGNREDLRALLNAGYRRGELVYRMGGGNNTTLESFRVFGAKALAGLGGLPPTLSSRCVRLELKRRRLDEPVEDFFPDELADQVDLLRIWLGSWAEVVLETLRAARPARVDGLRDRVNEVWRPLLAIAELDEGTWPARARRAAIALGVEDEDEASLGVLLLADVRAVFEEREAEVLAGQDLIRALADFEESPWADWWIDPKTEEPSRGAARRLAQLLRPYGVRSKSVRLDEKQTRKGYRREDFFDAWERFLPGSRPSGTSGTSGTTRSHKQTDVPDVPDVPDIRGTPVAGDQGFPDLVDAAFHGGHLTEAEWLERRKWHAEAVGA